MNWSLFLCLGAIGFHGIQAAGGPDLTKLYWDLQPIDKGQLYQWPPDNTKQPAQLTGWNDGDMRALSFMSIEVFQTLFSNNLKPMEPVGCHESTKDLSWTKNNYNIYASIFITSSVPKGPIPWVYSTKAKPALGLQDLVQYNIAINHWDSGFALLKSNDPKDTTHYGYANFKIAQFDESYGDRENAGQFVLPPIPGTISAHPNGISKQEWIYANQTGIVNVPCHVVQHTNNDPGKDT
ncbi:MAG: hypothetical protein Q9227_003361 [Pyrenula ochraceoflavens]